METMVAKWLRTYLMATNMQQSPRLAPNYVEFHQRDLNTGRGSRRPVSEPRITAHIWAAHTPKGIPAGCYVLEIQSTDMFENVDKGIRIIEVE